MNQIRSSDGGRRKLTLVDGLRGFAVVFGGPIVLVLWSIAGIVALLRAALGRSVPGGRIGTLGAGVGALLPVGYFAIARRWLEGWGATREERERPLPGDELTPWPAFKVTHAITIDAPVERVWPWIAQLGQDRAGFYSYEWLENLAGCEMRNTDRIVPEWQTRSIGETVYLHPAGGPAVSRFEPGHTMVLDPWGGFTVEPLPDGGTRLLARSAVSRDLVPRLFYLLLMEIPHFVMERRMLLGIKRLAEQPEERPITSGERPSHDVRDEARAGIGRHEHSAIK